MSFRVLVVPEDPTYNGYILKPIAERMLVECGRARASVEVLTSPRVRGYESAKRLLEEQILDRYAHYDLLLFLSDSDGKDRSADFERLEAIARAKGRVLLCCAAVQEVEAWLLAGHLDKLSKGWREIREDVAVKEVVFRPFLVQHGDPRRAGGGRDVLMEEALRSYRGILQRCPELAALENRIRAIVEAQPPGD